jgi:protein tyrosine/serine phosphatase
VQLDNQAAERTRRGWRRRRRLAIAFVAVLTVSALTFRRPWFAGNFGIVDPGRVYRSAQPTTQLGRLIHEHQLASVLNLRGGTMADAWYANEARLTRYLGVDFYDFPMNATRRPSRRELLVLIDLFRRCRYPLLIHCKSGSDRTGLASALYLMVIQGRSPNEALGAFTLFHGHIPFGGPEHLQEPFAEYAAWLVATGGRHSSETFRYWVETQYASTEPVSVCPPLLPGPRATIAEIAPGK